MNPAATHTPGPWTDDGISGATLIVHSQWGEVARVPNNGDEMQRNANAALIASAPDLLAERDALRADVAQLQLELTHYRHEHESLELQADALRAECTEKQRQCDVLKQALDAEVNKCVALRNELAKLNRYIDSLARD